MSISLRNARVLVVGAGGLGCPAAAVLAASGVGSLALADPDQVDLTNLHRQLLYRTADVGRPKVGAAVERLRRIHPTLAVTLEGLSLSVDATNAERLFRSADLVVDGTDSVETKFLSNDVALGAGVPLVVGGAVDWRGTVLCVARGAGACYRCLFEAPPEPGEIPSCADAGILGAVAGVVGALAGEAAIALLTGEARGGDLWSYDARADRIRRTALARRAGCTSCGGNTRINEITQGGSA